jgi:hypothetical protein
VQPAAHVEIDYTTFTFNLLDKDIFSPPSTREVASGTDTTYCDASCMAGSWFSFSDPIGDCTANDPIDDFDIAPVAATTTTPTINGSSGGIMDQFGSLGFYTNGDKLVFDIAAATATSSGGIVDQFGSLGFGTNGDNFYLVLQINLAQWVFVHTVIPSVAFLK